MIDLEALRRLKGLRIYQFFLDEKTGEITDITSRDDYVPVIRCKDCKYYDSQHKVCCVYVSFRLAKDADDYCSDAERKEE